MEARRGSPPLRSESSLRQAPRGRGVEGCATRCPGPILLNPAADSPGGPGGRRWPPRGEFPRRSVSRCAGGAWVCTPEGAAAATVSKTHREQRRGAHARRLPPPPGLASSPVTEAGGAHVGCRALARRLHPGRIPSRSCSPGMWGCDCYSTFRRRVSALLLGLRLALSPAWPRGMPPGRSADVTAMLCTSSPHPTPPFTLPLSVEPTCCSRKAHARQDAQIPPCRPLLRASALPSLPPLGRVCTTAEAPAC